MSHANSHTTTSIKIRFPNEVLEALNSWATLNGLSRSVACRRLMLRGLISWHEEAPTANYDLSDQPQAAE